MQKLVFFFLILIVTNCSQKPKSVEIKDVCSQPFGTNVILQGYLSLPKMIDTIQLTKAGKITAVGYQIFLFAETETSDDSVKVTLWTTNKAEPNKIKAFSNGYSWKDLLVYTNDGQEVKSRKTIKITGETTPDEKTNCSVSVTKIEFP